MKLSHSVANHLTEVQLSQSCSLQFVIKFVYNIITSKCKVNCTGKKLKLYEVPAEVIIVHVVDRSLVSDLQSPCMLQIAVVHAC